MIPSSNSKPKWQLGSSCLYKLLSLISIIALPVLILSVYFYIKNHSSYPAATQQESFTLNHIISQKYLNLTNRQMDDWQKVNILRQWAYENADVASNSCLLQNNPSFKFYSKSATELFEVFAQDKGGVWCAGKAFALMRLYQYYGFDSYVLSYGKNGLITHAVTLVKINHQGKDILAVEDSYFNLAYANRDNSPLDYFQLIKLLKNKREDKIKVIQDSKGKYHDFILCPNDNNKLIDSYSLKGHEPIQCQLLPDGRRKCRYGVSLEEFSQNSKLTLPTNNFLAQNGYPPNLIYLFLFPFGANDGTGENQRMLSVAQSIVKGNDIDNTTSLFGERKAAFDLDLKPTYTAALSWKSWQLSTSKPNVTINESTGSVKIVTNHSTYDLQSMSPPVQVNQRTRYLMQFDLKVDKGGASVSILGADRKTVLVSHNRCEPTADFFQKQLTFDTAGNSKIFIILSNCGYPEPEVSTFQVRDLNIYRVKLVKQGQQYSH